MDAPPVSFHPGLRVSARNPYPGAFYAGGVYGYLAGIKSKGRFIGMGKELASDDLIPVIAESIILGHGNAILFIVCLYVHLRSPSYLT